MYKTIVKPLRGMFGKGVCPCFCFAPLRTLITTRELGSNQQSLKNSIKKSHKYYCTLWTCAFLSVFCARARLCECERVWRAGVCACVRLVLTFTACMSVSVSVFVCMFPFFSFLLLGYLWCPISIPTCPPPPAVGCPCRCRGTKD